MGYHPGALLTKKARIQSKYLIEDLERQIARTESEKERNRLGQQIKNIRRELAEDKRSRKEYQEREERNRQYRGFDPEVSKDKEAHRESDRGDGAKRRK